MHIQKIFLLTGIALSGIYSFNVQANPYEASYGNDYANINAYNINRDSFKRDNIIQRDENGASINIPKPTGGINLNILGFKKKITLSVDDEEQQKRRRFFAAQKRKKAKLIQEERRQQEQDEILANTPPDNTPAVAIQPYTQSRFSEYEQFGNEPMNNTTNTATNSSTSTPNNVPTYTQGDIQGQGGYIPSTPPLGIPHN